MTDIGVMSRSVSPKILASAEMKRLCHQGDQENNKPPFLIAPLYLSSACFLLSHRLSSPPLLSALRPGISRYMSTDPQVSPIVSPCNADAAMLILV